MQITYTPNRITYTGGKLPKEVEILSKHNSGRLYLYNEVKDLVALHHKPAEFKNDSILVSNISADFLTAIKELGIKYVEKVRSTK